MNELDSLDLIRVLQEIRNEQPAIRDRFAMAYLAGEAARDVFSPEHMAKQAYRIADSMIKQRDLFLSEEKS